MEPHVLRPWSQELAVDLCPEPAESSPRTLYFVKIHVSIILPSVGKFLKYFFPSHIPTNLLYDLALIFCIIFSSAE
jgi:hypothetical protein